ncbi:helix-turn-helix domain-containing protein [Williamsia sp. 1138]|uniref:AraC family transcriptional regulator n=1 Tax=Williamsia sp. 1138 TaxID=1903117 RepID=UPI00143CFD69|nr:helix-turn-helix domain-containing protein [Williamsia sp. 1138]
MGYSEQRSTLVPATVWRRQGPVAPAEILPDGCMDLIWTGTGLLIAGPDTGPVTATGSGDMVALRFDPGVAPSVLGVPAEEMVNGRVDFADIAGSAQARCLSEQAAAGEPGDVLERFAAAQVDRSPPPRWLHPATSLLSAGHQVASVADQISASPRQLQRWSRHHYGYGAKALQRILRVNAAMADLRTGRSAVDTAHHCGYADYAHMFRDFRSVTGRPPADFRPPMMGCSGGADQGFSSPEQPISGDQGSAA